jgi:hypothetical protein
VYREVFLEEIVMGTGLDGSGPTASDAADEVSRQRRKHWDASLNRPVPGFPEMTLAEVVAEVEAATDDDSGVFSAPDELVVPGDDGAAGAVSRFLAGRGHTPATIRKVQGYLELQRALEAQRAASPRGLTEGERYAIRASVLEELQARLLKD